MLTTVPASHPNTLRAPWRASIAVGRAYELLRADTLAHLEMAQKTFRYKYCRFHGLFHDDMAVVRRRADGSLAFQWHQVDKVYDALLAMGLRPFVELNPMPAALASGSQTIFEWRMNVTPPKVWEEWGQLVHEFTRHVIARYGIAEVRQWYFEVWNEPNLPGFWSGTKEDYWQLYTHAAKTIKAIDGGLRVGGPASSKGSWVSDLIAYCGDHEVPLDFVSTHYYPQDVYNSLGGEPGEPEEGGDFFIRRVKEIRAEIDASARPELELHFTEWNTLYAESPENVTWTNNTGTDACFGAPLIVRICSELDGTVDSLCYWIASDVFEEAGLPHAAFDATYGYINIHGIPKAHFHAFEFLGRVTGERLDVSSGTARPRWSTALAAEEADVVRILLAYDRASNGEHEWSDEVELPFAGPDPIVIASRIAEGRGSAYETFVRLGRPQNLTPATQRLLEDHSRPSVDLTAFTADNGKIRIPFTLHPGEVLLLEVESAQAPMLKKGKTKEEVALWDQFMNDASKT